MVKEEERKPHLQGGQADLVHQHCQQFYLYLETVLLLKQQQWVQMLWQLVQRVQLLPFEISQLLLCHKLVSLVPVSVLSLCEEVDGGM